MKHPPWLPPRLTSLYLLLYGWAGWKIGWLVGHEKLVHGVMIANQWVQFSVATPLQRAVADILEEVRATGGVDASCNCRCLLSLPAA